jgi:hypothetical protein
VEIPRRVFVIVLLLGLVPSVLLWAFGLVAWWAVPLLTIPFAILLIVILVLVMAFAWMASGSH